MPFLNLKEYYPDCYKEDRYIEVSQEVIDCFESAKKEEAYRRRKYRYHAQYSLDREDRLENHRLSLLNADNAQEMEERLHELDAAMDELSVTARRRIQAHHLMGLSKTEIARMEGVSVMAVEECISRGLKQLKKILSD